VSVRPYLLSPKLLTGLRLNLVLAVYHKICKGGSFLVRSGQT